MAVKAFKPTRAVKSSFTLLELLLSVVIIGLIVSIGIVFYGNAIEKGRAAEAYSVLSQIVAAEKAYFVENDSYTADFANLHSFTAAPQSDNFTYSIPSTDSSVGYAEAAKKTGTDSYGMCLASGKRSSCSDSEACNPGCP